MTEFRNDLLTRIINVYGFENEVTIFIAHLLETQEDNEWNNKCLEGMVKAHEMNPLGMNDED